MHSLLLLLLLFLIVEKIGEMVSLGICWKLMNAVDSELDLDLDL
jgi:hypothetical protein